MDAPRALPRGMRHAWQGLTTMDATYDIAVIGSGFSGSLLAMAAHRMGRSVIMLERGQHPRFAIGESTTPLTNLLLDEFAREFDLPDVASLTKWSTWQGKHPGIGCGLKRGFTFYHHQRGKLFKDDADRHAQLLVAASPNERVADTHWYRPDFDHFLVQQAEGLGITYWDKAHIQRIERGADQWSLAVERDGKRCRVSATLIVDASGPRGCLFREFKLEESSFPSYPATSSVFAHFRNVDRTSDFPEFNAPEVPPYAPDDAAVHHVFEGGWIWVLRFNNGVTSAGAALTPAEADRLDFSNARKAWDQLLRSLPSVERQFYRSTPVTPFVHQPRMPFLCSSLSGPGWIMLPSAGGFVDPMFSSGFAQVLLGLHRLTRVLRTHWGTATLDQHLSACAEESRRDLLQTSRLVGGMYQVMHHPRKLFALMRLYFAAVIWTETKRRLGEEATANDGFLLRHHDTFSQGLHRCLNRAGELSEDGLASLVAETIAPIDLADLCDSRWRNWIPVDFEPLRRSAHKLGVSPGAIEQLIRQCDPV